MAFQKKRPEDIVSKYLAVRLPDGSFKWAHVLVAERALGRTMPDGAIVHHVDEDGHNNANRNLVICQDQAYHKLLHARARIVRAGGNPNADAWCSRCRRPRPRSMFTARLTGEGAGRLKAFCRPCGKAYLREWKSDRAARRMEATV